MQFHAAYAVASRDKQEDGIKPDRQRGAALFKDGASAGIEVVAAMGAGISLAVLKAVERSINHPALTAGVTMAVADRHNVFQTSGIVREALEELPNVHFASVVLLVHVNFIVYTNCRVNLKVYRWQKILRGRLTPFWPPQS